MSQRHDDGRPAWYDVAGPTGAPPLVLLHGSEITRRMWLPQVEGLADEFRLLVPDLSGHGVLADEPFLMDAAVERLCGLIDAEAGGRALVVGLSLGGYVAMALAARCPDKPIGLVLASCSGIPRGSLTLPYRLYAQIARVTGRRSLERLQRFFLRCSVPGPLADRVLAGGVYPAATPQVVGAITGRDVLADLAGYPGPILLVNGRWDLLFRRHEAEFLAALPRAELLVIPHAAHLVNLQQPAAFNDAVRRFAHSLNWST